MRLDRAALAGRVAAFEDDDDLQPLVADPLLELDELDLEGRTARGDTPCSTVSGRSHRALRRAGPPRYRRARRFAWSGLPSISASSSSLGSPASAGDTWLPWSSSLREVVVEDRPAHERERAPPVEAIEELAHRKPMYRRCRVRPSSTVDGPCQHSSTLTPASSLATSWRTAIRPSICGIALRLMFVRMSTFSISVSRLDGRCLYGSVAVMMSMPFMVTVPTWRSPRTSSEIVAARFGWPWTSRPWAIALSLSRKNHGEYAPRTSPSWPGSREARRRPHDVRTRGGPLPAAGTSPHRATWNSTTSPSGSRGAGTSERTASESVRYWIDRSSQSRKSIG